MVENHSTLKWCTAVSYIVFFMCLIFIVMVQDKVWKWEASHAESLDLDVKWYLLSQVHKVMQLLFYCKTCNNYSHIWKKLHLASSSVPQSPVKNTEVCTIHWSKIWKLVCVPNGLNGNFSLWECVLLDPQGHLAVSVLQPWSRHPNSFTLA